MIDRPAAAPHPQIAKYPFPLDCGIVHAADGGEGAGIDIWIAPSAGWVPPHYGRLDPVKRDAEVKIAERDTPKVDLIERFYGPKCRWPSILAWRTPKGSCFWVTR